MASRLKLHEVLCNVLGNRNAYFQPPTSVEMSYPAIRYSLDNIKNGFANNEVYMQSHYYQLTVIDYDPDSEIAAKVSKLPTCKFIRTYTADNLNHWVFRIYF